MNSIFPCSLYIENLGIELNSSSVILAISSKDGLHLKKFPIFGKIYLGANSFF